MIPLRLQLSNFLSYREMPEPLDLSDVRLGCLSGPNGHGKSALLDAITWALWGKARGCEGGQEQERLIRDGADATRVEFVFSLEGQTYRVARSRTRTGKGDVAFNVQAPDGGWTDLAGEGLLDTQRKIIERLRMDYETFVASAFILQGRADTFTRLDPRERKDVLGKILSLEIYERLAERARERKKEAQAEADGFARALETLERDLAGREEQERRAAEAREELTRADADRAEADGALATLRERVGELQGLQAAAVEIRKRREEASSTLDAEQRAQTALSGRADELEVAAKLSDDDREAAAGLPELEKTEARLEEARTRHDELAGEAASLTARLGEERSRLEAEAAAARRSAGKLDEELAAEPEARGLLERAETELATLEETAASRERLLRRRVEIKQRQSAADAERDAREAERATTEEKLALLAGTDACCPLCGQDLTPAHRRQVRASFNARIKELAAVDRSATKETRALAEELAKIEGEAATLASLLERRQTITAQAAALRQHLERLGDARTERDAAHRLAGEIVARLEAQDFAHGEREKLSRLREEIVAVGFDPEALRDVKAALERARRADRAVSEARQAQTALEACRREAAAAAERAGRAVAALTQADGDLRAMGERLEALPGLLSQQAKAERGRAEAQRRVEEAGKRLAAAEHALEVLARKATEAAEAKAARTAAKRTATLYDKLAKAFGRDGIPARIIGNAIPELRIEANRLLGLLTDGQLSLSIDPVRETKSRSLKETLEVTVFDAAGGKRPYEMYSGGERLRIDFALRVALSRLLANRAGARLETLVVDEGFGSQDTEGRMRLLEAVMRVRQEFRTVLVITHIEELKEHFPVRIEVRKDPQAGSLVSVV